MDNNGYIMAFVFAIVAIEILWIKISQIRNKKIKIKNRDSKNYNLKNPKVLYSINMKFDEFSGFIRKIKKFSLIYLKTIFYVAILVCIISIAFAGYLFINMNISFESALIFITVLIMAYLVVDFIKAFTFAYNGMKNIGSYEITINILKEGIQYYSETLNKDVLLKWDEFRGYKLKNNSIALYGNSKIFSKIFGAKYYLKCDNEKTEGLYSKSFKNLENIVRRYIREL
ncbi:hypothetical protein Mjas_04195 [Methanothermococcus sp. Ax23]|uniref:hypothetical protein n=1 Tax=Methanothermococcus sp. Ax23 TaxID=3156486 RepID=UPI003BA2915D